MAPPYRITLMGMSGVGKSYLSAKLARWGWVHYSCDLEIGRKLLDKPDEITANDISKLANFLGMPGDPAQGGKSFEGFKERQKQYYDAEVEALLRIGVEIEKAGERNFVNDSTGSFCEIEDPQVSAFVGEKTRIVYIKASPEEEQALVERARAYPKPLFYPPSQLDTWLKEYLAEQDLASMESMEPEGFVRWVFPKLLAARKPKYEALAVRYGMSVTSAQVAAIASEADFLRLVER